MSRKISAITYIVSKPESVEDPVTKIKELAQEHVFTLLAHADDGVIWGRAKDGKLNLSGDKDAFPDISPKLRKKTLWEARLFNTDTEWFIWQDGGGWKIRQITDGEGEESEAFTESCILWGTNHEEQVEKAGFFLAEEADLGVRHTPPLALSDRHSLELSIRHYIDYDDEGAAYVKLSRLVDLENGVEK